MAEPAHTGGDDGRSDNDDNDENDAAFEADPSSSAPAAYRCVFRRGVAYRSSPNMDARTRDVLQFGCTANVLRGPLPGSVSWEQGSARVQC